MGGTAYVPPFSCTSEKMVKMTDSTMKAMGTDFEPLDAETMQRIMVEVDLGIPESESRVPLTPATAAFRAEMKKQIAEMRKKGRMLHFTPEFP